MRLTLFHGVSDATLASLAEWSQVSVTVGPNGLDAAEVVVPHAYAKSLGAAYWLAGNIGARVEIDARDVCSWLLVNGQCGVPNVDEAHTTVGMSLVGPMGQLAQYSMGGLGVSIGPAGYHIRAALGSHPANLRLRPGHITIGKSGISSLQADAVSDFLGELADQTSEEPYLRAERGRPTNRIDWRVPLGESRPQFGEVVLVEGKNCEIAPAYNLSYAASDLALAGASTDQPMQGVNTSKHVAPDGLVLGREPALSAYINQGTAWGLVAGGEVAMRPDLVGIPALQVTADGQLRDRLSVPLGITARLTRLDRAFLSRIMVGDLVSVRYPSDFLGLWDVAIGRIQAFSAQLFPSLSVDLNVQLWRSDV